MNIGEVITCPKEISETGFVLIVGDQTNCDPQTLNRGCRWDYQVISYDIYKQETLGEGFGITKEEIEKWGKK